MSVLVNGKQYELGTGETLAALLERLGVQGAYALVERNGQPVERERYANVTLQSGDVLVVARPVAGG